MPGATCPIRLLAEDLAGGCIEGTCAWWDNVKKCCALVSIAQMK